MCGIVAIFGGENVALNLIESLIHLQHRGQDAAGIATFANTVNLHKSTGLVSQIFDAVEATTLAGDYGIGHTRYPTEGGKVGTAQPYYYSKENLEIALAHNGNLIDYTNIVGSANSDSETILRLFSNNLEDCEVGAKFFHSICAAVNTLFQILKGSIAVVIGIKNKGVVAFRDPYGIRPLVIGEKTLANGAISYIIASEPTMFYALDFKLKRDIFPGEVVYIDPDGNFFAKQIFSKGFSPCIFEYVYFARADAIIDDVSVYRARLRMGQNLAIQWHTLYPDCIPDVVVPVPYTANTAAQSFAAYFKVRYCEALHKNTFINRTFITAGQSKRVNLVRHKFTPQPLEIKGKNVMLIDDSIVRGTTSKEIVNMVKEQEPKKIYFASAAPPLKHPCFYGINIPTKEELLAHRLSIPEIKAYLGVDELLYQTEEDLIEAIRRRGEHQINSPCRACMNGKYLPFSST